MNYSKLIIASILFCYALVQCKKSEIEPLNLNENSYSDENFQIIQGISDVTAITFGESNSIVLAGIAERNNFGVLKLSENGDEEWIKSFGGTQNDFVSEIITTHNGDYVLIGSSRSFTNGQNDVYVVRVSNQGREIWSNNYGTNEAERGKSIFQTSDNGFIVTGNSSLDVKSYILKLTDYGEVSWSAIQEGPRNTVFSILELNDGSYLFGGTSLIGNNTIVELTKRDSVGTRIWSKSISNLGNILLNDGLVEPILKFTEKGTIIMATNTSSNQSNISIFELDEEGNIMWTNQFGGPETDRVNELLVLEGEGYLLIGETMNFGNGGGDILIIKVNQEGQEIWKKTYGGNFYDYSTDAILLNQQIYITGRSYQDEKFNSRKSILIKIDKEGNPI